MATNTLRAVPRPSESDVDKAMRRMADLVHQMNQAIGRVVDLGVTVELMRCSRYHDEQGNWGDQMIPLVRMPGDSRDGDKSDPA